MLSQKTKLFTIGQFANLHHINKKTLMWYDDTGILKPAVIGENGYRYYTYYQSSVLETILLLRELGVSIKEIRDFMSRRSASALEQLLTEKIAQVDKTVDHLLEIKRTMIKRRDDMRRLLDTDISAISLVEKAGSCLVTAPFTTNSPFEQEMAAILAQIKKHSIRRLYDVSYGVMISVDNLYRGDFESYSSMFIEMPQPVSEKDIHVQPGGKYLRAFHKGDWGLLYQKYQEILEYAADNDLHFYGFSYETGINDIVIDELDDYIIQIEIPVKENKR